MHATRDRSIRAIGLLIALSSPLASAGDPSDRGSLSNEYTPGTAQSIDASTISMHKVHAVGSPLLSVENRTRIDLRVYDSGKIDNRIEAGLLGRWHCEPEESVNLQVETIDGLQLEALALSCGDVLIIGEDTAS